MTRCTTTDARVFLDIRNFTYPEQGAPLIGNVCLSVAAGEFVSIVGPTGAGKSTLLRIVAGLETHYTGTVKLDGVQVSKPSRAIQIVFQDYRLLPWKTVEANMLLAAPTRTPKKRVSSRAHELLAELGLKDVKRSWPNKLSGGQRASLAFARAFMDPPRVLLLDEPFIGLDLGSKFKLRESLTEAALRRKTTVIMVSHSVDDAVFLSDRVHVFTGNPLKIVKTFEVDVPRDKRERANPTLLNREEAIAALLLKLGEL